MHRNSLLEKRMWADSFVKQNNNVDGMSLTSMDLYRQYSSFRQ